MTDPITVTGRPGDPYLAVDVQPDVVHDVFTLNVSQLNGPHKLARSDLAAGLWDNVVCDVQAVNFRRGVASLQGLLTAVEAGTATVVLSDTHRSFDPMVNADAIHKGTPLRIRAWGTDVTGERWDAVLWTGEIDGVGVQYHPADPPTVTLTGVDIVGVLAAWEAEGRPEPGVGAGDTLLDRAQRVLTEVGRGTIASASDVTYAATLAPTVLARPWDELSAAVEAELGRLWVNRSNQLVLRARGSELSGTVRGTLTDVHGYAELGVHCCTGDAVVAYDWETAGNRVLARRRAVGEEEPAAAVRRDDIASQARYGVGVVRREGLELQLDAQVGPWAEAVIVAHSRPRLRVDQVQPAPSPVDLDSALTAWPAVLATDVGDRWLFQYHPSVGPTVDRAVGVLGIELEASPDGWSVVWTTAAAPAPGRLSSSGWFVLNESKINSGDVLAPFRAPVS